MKKSLRNLALDSVLCSRFVAREDDLNRPLTDAEIINETKYQLETIDYSGYDNAFIKTAKKQLKQIIKRGALI